MQASSESNSNLSNLQVDNNLKNLPKLDLLKSKVWFISYGGNNRIITLEYQLNPQIFSVIQKNMRSSVLESPSRTQSNKVELNTKFYSYRKW
jgi:hypothetical protein